MFCRFSKIAISFVALFCAMTGYSQVNKYDVNGDGSINTADVVAVYNIIIGGNLCPDSNHPHSIDLGLPSGTKWACCNVGSNTPEGYGGLYAWGEIEEKEEYSISNYKHYDALAYTYVSLGNDIAGTEWDVAYMLWTTEWQMPTTEQVKELLDYTTSNWSIVNGVNGREFVGKNGATIFIPAAGACSYSNPFGKDSDGYYWTATQHPGYAGRAYVYTFNYLGSGGGCVPDARVTGYSVRAIAR